MARHAGIDDDTPIRPRSRGVPVAAIVGVVSAAALVAVVITFIVVLAGRSAADRGTSADVSKPLVGGPSEGKEGETWNHRELVAYLNSRGLHVHQERVNFKAWSGPTCELTTDGVMVDCQIRSSRQDAHDHAGDADVAFSWGKFLFTGTRESRPLAQQIAAALGTEIH